MMSQLDGMDGRMDGRVFGQQIPGGGMGGMPMGAHGGMGGMPMGGGGMLPALQHPYTDLFLSGIMSPFYLYFFQFLFGDFQHRHIFLWLCCWYARVSRVDESADTEDGATHRGRRLRYFAPVCFHTGAKVPGLGYNEGLLVE